MFTVTHQQEWQKSICLRRLLKVEVGMFAVRSAMNEEEEVDPPNNQMWFLPSLCLPVHKDRSPNPAPGEDSHSHTVQFPEALPISSRQLVNQFVDNQYESGFFSLERKKKMLLECNDNVMQSWEAVGCHLWRKPPFRGSKWR